MLLKWTDGLNSAWTTFPGDRRLFCTWSVLSLKAAEPHENPGRGVLYPERLQVSWGTHTVEVEGAWTLDLPRPMLKPMIREYVLDDVEQRLLTPFEQLSLQVQ